MGGSGSKDEAALKKKEEEEAAKAAQKAEEEKQAAKKAEEEKKAAQAAEAAKKAEEEKRAAEAAKAAREEEERKAAEAAEAAKKAEEKKAADAAEAARKADEKKAADAAEAARKAEEKKAADAAEAARKAEEEKKAADAAEAARKAEEEKKAADAAEAAEAARKAEETNAAKAAEAAEAAANADAPLKAEEVKVELASGLTKSETAGAPPSASLRRAAALLRRLQPKQRPATAERLQAFLRLRCCSRVGAEPGKPGALAAAILRELQGRPGTESLQDAIKPFVPTATAEEPVSVKQGAKAAVAQIMQSEEKFLSQSLVWRARWLLQIAKNTKGFGAQRVGTEPLFQELKAVGAVVEAPVQGKEGLCLTYDEKKLEAVPEPLQVAEPFVLNEEVQAGELKKAMAAVPQEVFTMPVLCVDMRISLGQGSIRKANTEKLKDGAKTPSDLAKKFKAATCRWLNEAAPSACSSWGKACLQTGDLLVSAAIAPKPEGDFESTLRRVIENELNLVHDYEVHDLIMDAAFWGQGGNNVKVMSNVLGIAMDIVSKKKKSDVNGSIKFTIKPDNKLSEETIRRAILLLAGSRSIPICVPVEKKLLRHVIGKGGSQIRNLQVTTQTRLRVVDDARVIGWPLATAMPTEGQEKADWLATFQETLKAKTTELENKIKVILIRCQAAVLSNPQKESDESFCPGAAAVLGRTFSNEYRAIKVGRDAKRETERAKKALAASRKQGGGGRWQKQGDLISWAAVAAIMELKREVIAGFRSLNEGLQTDNMTTEQLEEERAELEDSMRELLAAASEALQQFRDSPLKGGRLLEDFRALLDPDNYKRVSTKSLAQGELIEQIKTANVWQRLDALAKPRNEHPQKEVLVHVRKGKPVRRAMEKGGRYKPGEAASARGQSVEEGLAPTPMVSEDLLPPDEVDEVDEDAAAEAAEEAADGAAVKEEATEKKEAASSSEA